jgi:hypothetical protein
MKKGNLVFDQNQYGGERAVAKTLFHFCFIFNIRLIIGVIYKSEKAYYLYRLKKNDYFKYFKSDYGQAHCDV